MLAGGLSHERDVSLRSGRRVAEALRDSGHRGRGARRRRRRCSARLQRGPAGVRAAAAARRVRRGRRAPRGARAGRRALRRLAARAPAASRSTSRWPRPLVARAGVRTPRGVTLPAETFRELGAAAVMAGAGRGLGLPLIVKPARGGSALGCSVVARARPSCPGAMVDAFAYGDTALVESFVAGTEVAVPVVDTGDGPRALPVGRRSRPTGASTTTPRATPPARPSSRCRRSSTDEVAAECARVAVDRPRDAGPARPVPLRPDRRRRRGRCGSSRSTSRPVSPRPRRCRWRWRPPVASDLGEPGGRPRRRAATSPRRRPDAEATA